MQCRSKHMADIPKLMSMHRSQKSDEIDFNSRRRVNCEILSDFCGHQNVYVLLRNTPVLYELLNCSQITYQFFFDHKRLRINSCLLVLCHVHLIYFQY